MVLVVENGCSAVECSTEILTFKKSWRLLLVLLIILSCFQKLVKFLTYWLSETVTSKCPSVAAVYEGGSR
jgi:hypothetical protein